MAFFTTAITTLKTLVCAIGAGLAAWGVINLLEGYGTDNPGAKSQGIKQLMAGGGIVLIGINLIPQLAECRNKYCDNSNPPYIQLSRTSRADR